MGERAQRRATYQDVLETPAHLVAELIAGTLRTHPRPRTRHARASSRLGARLGGPFDEGTDGPGGWILLDEPELHLGPDPDVLVPDLAGWRRVTLPQLPDEPHLAIRPDWVCEVISPSTAKVDRAEKVPIYGRERVGHVWLLDPDLRTLEILRLDGDGFRLVGTWRDDEICRPEPFDAIELPLEVLWAR